MKKIIYAALIVCLAIVFINLSEKIIISAYHISKNVIETGKFRSMNVDEKSILNAAAFSRKSDADMSRVLTCNFIYNSYQLKRQRYNLKKYKELNNSYIKADRKEYSKVCKAMAAIFDDIKYFPVAKSSLSKYWISFEDSFGADRNYNGEYKHEGTDIMAGNNISGFYPIVSATDGVVENIGWLEKGGYRVGIRGKSGGYFYYAHLSSYSNIKSGDKVKAGTLLGYMGDTGYGKAEGTSGNFAVHLHFGIYIKTENYEELSINPYNVLKYLENKLIVANY